MPQNQTPKKGRPLGCLFTLAAACVFFLVCAIKAQFQEDSADRGIGVSWLIISIILGVGFYSVWWVSKHELVKNEVTQQKIKSAAAQPMRKFEALFTDSYNEFRAIVEAHCREEALQIAHSRIPHVSEHSISIVDYDGDALPSSFVKTRYAMDCQIPEGYAIRREQLTSVVMGGAVGNLAYNLAGARWHKARMLAPGNHIQIFQMSPPATEPFVFPLDGVTIAIKELKVSSEVKAIGESVARKLMLIAFIWIPPLAIVNWSSAAESWLNDDRQRKTIFLFFMAGGLLAGIGVILSGVRSGSKTIVSEPMCEITFSKDNVESNFRLLIPTGDQALFKSIVEGRRNA